MMYNCSCKDHIKDVIT